MKVLATIEARMGASRLPGKVMLSMEGAPMIQQKIERVQRSKIIDDIKVLTTIDPMNQIIEDFCNSKGYKVFRGSEDDILDRVIQGTAGENPDIIVQLTGDNPLIDPKLIDDTIQYLIDNDLDLVSNSLTQPVLIGMNVRCFKRSALLKADKLCRDPMIRVHGGYYIQQHPEIFKVGENPVDPEYLIEDIRLTVDEPNDFELARVVFEQLLPAGKDFGIDEILGLFARQPELKEINGQVRQKKVGEG